MFTHVNHNYNFRELETITIDGKRWYISPDGHARYPSVTSVLGDGPLPQRVLDWQRSLGQNNAQKELTRASNRGTQVHLIIERYLNNESNIFKGMAPANIKLFNQAKIALNKINNIIAQEACLYSDDLMIAGRCDCIADYNSVLSIVDFKTANNIRTADMIEKYYLQITAYALLFQLMFNIVIRQGVVIITCEKSFIPQKFIVTDLDQYITPLATQINTFHRKHN